MKISAGKTNIESVAQTVFREQFAEYINQVAYGHVRLRVMRHGKAVAAVVPIEDAELLEALENQVDLEEARRALAEARDTGATLWKQLKKDLNL